MHQHSMGDFIKIKIVDPRDGEQGWEKVSSQPGVPPFETWTIQLVMLVHEDAVTSIARVKVQVALGMYTFGLTDTLMQ